MRKASDDGQNEYGGCPTALEPIGGSLIRLIKPQYSLCSFENDLFAEVLVPVGALDPKAYLHIVSYAIEGLRSVEQDIGIPLRITGSSDNLLYQSERWVADSDETHLYPLFRLYGDDSFLAATIVGSFDQQPFISRLAQTETSFFVHYDDRNHHRPGACRFHAQPRLPADEQTAQFGWAHC